MEVPDLPFDALVLVLASAGHARLRTVRPDGGATPSRRPVRIVCGWNGGGRAGCACSFAHERRRGSHRGEVALAPYVFCPRSNSN